MTKEEAIKTLRELWRETNDSWYEETYNMAIEALERTSNAHPTHECVKPTHECVEKQVTGKLINVEIPTKRKSEETEKHERIFQEIVVEYPSISTYPEHEGKPYFSIKYVEDGRGYIGYGTYNPEVLSEYMKEYFIPSELVGNSDQLNRTCAECKHYTEEHLCVFWSYFGFEPNDCCSRWEGKE